MHSRHKAQTDYWLRRSKPSDILDLMPQACIRPSVQPHECPRRVCSSPLSVQCSASVLSSGLQVFRERFSGHIRQHCQRDQQSLRACRPPFGGPGQHSLSSSHCMQASCHTAALGVVSHLQCFLAACQGHGLCRCLELQTAPLLFSAIFCCVCAVFAAPGSKQASKNVQSQQGPAQGAIQCAACCQQAIPLVRTICVCLTPS